MPKSQQIQVGLLTFVFSIALYFIINPRSLASEAPDFSFRYSSDNRLAMDQTLTLHISFKWDGDDEDYRFAVPSIFAQNLELLRIGQSSKKEKTTVIKEFEYEFKPLSIGDASIQNFEFPYTHVRGPERRSVPIPGKHLRIVSQRKFRALWLIWLIILPVSFLVLVTVKKHHKLHDQAVNHRAAHETIEEKMLKQMDQIDSRLPIEQKLDILAKLLHDYRKAKWSDSNTDRESQENLELNLLIAALKEARFSGNRLTDSDCQNIVNRVTLFIKKHQVIEPS